MTDECRVIDINKAKMLKQGDHNLTPANLQTKIKFVEVSEGLISAFFKDHVSVFDITCLFCDELPEEVLNEFTFKRYELTKAVEDLNVLASIERMIGLNPVIFSPTCTDANMVGWIAGFHLENCVFSSPELKTECFARAFNILLFLRMKQALKVKAV